MLVKQTVYTEPKVVAFLTVNFLRADGIVGSITANSINSAYAHAVKANAIIATEKHILGYLTYGVGSLLPQDLIVQDLFNMSLPITGLPYHVFRMIKTLWERL